MAQWGLTGTQASNTPKWSAAYISAGSGKTNKASNNTALFQNSTPEVFAKNSHLPFQSSGTFALSAAQRANTSGESLKVHHAGWQLREAFEGPVVSAAVVAAFSANTANGETVTFSNGSANGIGTLTTNATGNAVSISFPIGAGGGRFVNSSIVAFSFNREKHLLSITPTAAGSSGWTNGDIVFAGNGIITGIGVITTSASGNLASVAVNAAANGGFGSGLWGNAVANSVVTFTFQTANVSAVNGASAFTANLITSTGGNLSTIVCGGRAGRVQYECLVSTGSLTQANNPILPS